MIEKPQPEDVPLIERIARETGVFNEADLAIIREMLNAYFHPEPRDDHTFLVYRNGSLNSIQGFACFGPTALTIRNWDLYWICVARQCQGSGIGSKLLSTIEEELRQRHARVLYLETSDSSAYLAARQFYARNGYEEVAHLTDFYAPGEGKVIYRKVFEPTPATPTP